MALLRVSVRGGEGGGGWHMCSMKGKTVSFCMPDTNNEDHFGGCCLHDLKRGGGVIHWGISGGGSVCAVYLVDTGEGRD